MFPGRDDFIRSAWVRRARTKRAQEYEELYPYFSDRSPAAALRDATTSITATVTAATTTTIATTATTAAATTTTTTTTTPAAPATEALTIAASPPHHQRPTLDALPRTKALRKGTAATPLEGGTKSQHHMGVGTGSRNVAELRRAFRRLEPENMFRAPRVEGEPIWAYWGEAGGGESGAHGHGQRQSPLPPAKRANAKDGFVLVPAKELAELRALEGALRKERGILNAHCLIALNAGEVCVLC